MRDQGSGFRGVYVGIVAGSVVGVLRGPLLRCEHCAPSVEGLGFKVRLQGLGFRANVIWGLGCRV